VRAIASRGRLSPGASVSNRPNTRSAQSAAQVDTTRRSASLSVCGDLTPGSCHAFRRLGPEFRAEWAELGASDVLVANRKQGCADSSDPSEHRHDRLRGTTPLRLKRPRRRRDRLREEAAHGEEVHWRRQCGENALVTAALNQLQRLFAEHDLGFADALQILSSHFRLASSSSDRAVSYSHDGRDALVLTFNRKREFVGLDVGPGLRHDDLVRLAEKFTASRPRRVMGTVIFGTVPTVGWWRYRDRFQIFPMLPEAPRPPQVFGGVHPVMLEVSYDGASHDQLDEYRGAVATREINRLLSGLLRDSEDRLGHFVRMDWVVLPKQDADGVDRWQAHFGQLAYFLEGEHARRTDAFTEVPTHVPPLELSPKDEYYARRGISDHDVLVLPDTIEPSLDSYFRLERDPQDVVLRWCHWLNHARQVAPLSPSASAIAAVQAVEALLPSASPTRYCEACRRPIGPSIRQLFTGFLQQYAPGDDNATARDQLYDVRSKLAHGGTLLTGELRHLAFRDFVPRSWDEREVAERSLMLARLAGVNWVLARNGSRETEAQPPSSSLGA